MTQALTRRGITSALPLAALVAAIATPASAGDDAALLEIGGRWQAAWAAVLAHDSAWKSSGEEEAEAYEATGDRLYAAENALRHELMALPVRTLQGLCLKAQVTARCHDVDVAEVTVDAVETALEGAWDLERHSALSLALEVLKFTRAST